MSKAISIFLSFLFLGGLAYGGFWLYQHQEAPKPPAHFMILLDRTENERWADK